MMKTHFFRGLLLLAVMFATAATFNSCKDVNEDLQLENQVQLDDLQTQINDLKLIRGEMEELHKACSLACANARAELQALLEQYADGKDAALMVEISNLYVTKADLTSKLDGIQGQIDAIDGLIETINTTLQNLENDKLDKADFEAYKVTVTDAINQAMATTLKESKDYTDQVKVTLEASIGTLQATLAGKADQSEITRLEDLITQLQNDLKEGGAIETIINNYITKHLSAAIADALKNSTDMQTAKSDIVALQAAETEIRGLIGALQLKDTELEGLIDGLEARVATLESKVATLETKLETEVAALETSIANLTQTLNTEVTDLKLADQALKTDLENLKTSLDNLADRVKANEDAIDQLQKEMNDLTGRTQVLENRLNKLITSVGVQAVYNPVFGFVNLPTNTRSNVLMGQFGESTLAADYTFPSVSTVAEYNNQQHIIGQDINMLKLSGNFESITVQPGQVLKDGDNGINVGTVYMTINPNNVDFTGGNLTLVDTQDGESGVTLTNVKKSDKVLTFGVSRAANNGFYEASAYVAEADINKAEFTVSSEFKSAAKDLLDNPKSPGKYADLLVKFATMFNQKAYGLRAGWEAEGTQYATYSDYNIAATVYKPLSFKFLEGTSLSQLPTITGLGDFKFDLGKFDFNIKIPAIDIDNSDVDITLKDIELKSDKTISVWVDMPEFGADGKFTGNYVATEFNVPQEDIDALLEDISKSLNAELGSWSADIEASIEKEINDLIAEINSQVENALNEVSGSVNDELQNLIDEIEKEINDRVNGILNDNRLDNLIDAYNRVANRLNSILSDPNNYLQVMMVYKGNDGAYHQMSNSKAIPTVFKLNGGNAIPMYTTTYSAELVAPAYKKFIGVTNVWDEKGNSAAAGDATCQELLKDANSTSLFNHPVTGKTIRVPLKVSKAGYTYEILYTAMDYSGVTSTRKFYVKVQ